MWTSTVDLSPHRILLTNLLGRFWRGAYFSSFAPLRVQNVPRQPLPDTTWVRVRNKLAGICGSDLHLIHADGDLRVAPAALPGHTTNYVGHEVVGEVIEIGDDVQQLQVGDRVVLQHGPNCLSANVQPLCRSCASGNYTLCERGVLPGPQPIGAGWSEEMLLSEQQLFRVPDAMSDTQAVLLEPSSVAVHTVLRHVPQPGDRVLIIGAGTIGLLTLQAVRALSPDVEISVQARYPFQVEKATRMGAAHIIYPQDSYRGVQQATQAQLYTGMLGNKMLLGGYDVIYDTIGNRQTIHDALRWARAKGTVVLVGLSLHMMHIDLTPVWYQEINLIGTMGQGMETWPMGSNRQRSTFSITADMIMNNALRPESLITHHFALNNYQQALLTAIDKREQRAIKVVFDYSLLPPSVVPNVRASARQRRLKPIDTRALSPLATKDLSPREPALPVHEQTVTPAAPVALVTHTVELPPRIVPAPSVNITPPLEAPSLDSETYTPQQVEPVGTASARPLPLSPVDEPVGTASARPLAINTEEQPTDNSEDAYTEQTATVFSQPTLETDEQSQEAFTASSQQDKTEHIAETSEEEMFIIPQPAQDHITEQHVEETPAVSLPTDLPAQDLSFISSTQNDSPILDSSSIQEMPTNNDSPILDSSPMQGLPTHNDSPAYDTSTTDVPQVSAPEQELDALPVFDQEPLNDLEWLDVMNAVQNEPEVQELQDVQYVPDVMDAPPGEDAWMDEDMTRRYEPDYGDIVPDTEGTDLHSEGEETATNTTPGTFMTTKKDVKSGKSRSKNKYKGKHITGSFRS